ncbi:uncharacterized protein LOC101890890 [Musca domestica]|uniref:Uncharacterized protein LOC101890890 n=1 Tax=Musca domestica TaxID=7370 RepID=A0A1I8M625_MUSDO|nr:uncharacterized protein LOC101890890 [Musca domestica]
MFESNEIVVVDKESINSCDPHGYYSEYCRQEVNFKSPGKRSFLNECIRQIYILHGSDVSTMTTIPVEFNRCVLWNAVNALMMPQKLSHYQASVEKVKRRLFRESKIRQRKSRKPSCNNGTASEFYFYKSIRSDLGIKKIPRTYLDEARQRIYAERSQNLKRKHGEMDGGDADDDLRKQAALHLATKEGVFQVSQQVINKVCRYHGNMARQHPQRERSMEEQLKRERNTEACRLTRRAKKLEEMLVEQQYRERLEANEKVLEASIRSILYMKALMGLMVNGSIHPQEDRSIFI